MTLEDSLRQYVADPIWLYIQKCVCNYVENSLDYLPERHVWEFVHYPVYFNVDRATHQVIADYMRNYAH